MSRYRIFISTVQKQLENKPIGPDLLISVIDWKLYLAGPYSALAGRLE